MNMLFILMLCKTHSASSSDALMIPGGFSMSSIDSNRLIPTVLLLTGVVEIMVGDNPGVGTLRFSNLTYNVYIWENSGYNTPVVTVKANFVSSGTRSAIYYSFASGNEDSTFSIHPETGNYHPPCLHDNNDDDDDDKNKNKIDIFPFALLSCYQLTWSCVMWL